MEIQIGKYYELGRKALLYSVAQKSVTSIFIAVIGIILVVVGASIAPTYSWGSTLETAALAIIAIAIFIEIVAAVAARMEYSVSKVMLDDTSLRIVRGIFRKEEVAIPFRRIQSVEIKQGPMHQVFKVGHVVISTTTDLEQPGKTENEADEEVVPIMDYDLSKAIADVLTSRAEVERMHVEDVKA
ncbi:PH domain-containing protein [Patescibacteria group bacterium]|nr:PH domain-containing protein [Patescibacteria group bacterium]